MRPSSRERGRSFRESWITLHQLTSIRIPGNMVVGLATNTSDACCPLLRPGVELGLLVPHVSRAHTWLLAKLGRLTRAQLQETLVFLWLRHRLPSS